MPGPPPARLTNRRVFLALATTRGARWLVDVSNHTARVVSLAGLLVGASITGVLTGHPLAIAVVVVGLAVVAFGEGAYSAWLDSERRREAVAEELEAEAHGLRAADERKATSDLLVSILSVYAELSYIENRIEEGPLGDDPLPNLEWVRQKDRIAAARGDIFMECDRAYQEADRLHRIRAQLEAMDEDDLEYNLKLALEVIREASEHLGEWENALLMAAETVDDSK